MAAPVSRMLLAALAPSRDGPREEGLPGFAAVAFGCCFLLSAGLQKDKALATGSKLPPRHSAPGALDLLFALRRFNHLMQRARTHGAC